MNQQGIDWNVLDYKFSHEKYAKFEELAYDMFCRAFDLTGDLQLTTDHRGLENPRIKLSNGIMVGFIAKYYEDQTVNARRLYEIRNAVVQIAKEDTLDILYIYTNKEFALRPKGKTKTVAEMALEETAKKVGIEICWMTRSRIEMALCLPSMSDLYEKYFRLEGVCDSQYWRTTDTLYKYMSLDKLEDAIKYGVATSCLGLSDPVELEGVEHPSLYRKCCMTNSPKQMMLWAYYGCHHRGCCVEFDVSGIDRILLRKVEYTTEISSHADMTPEEICEDLYKAGEEWKHENEYRAVFYKRNFDKMVWEVLEDDKVYLKAKVKSVTFGLHSEENADTYRECLELLKRKKIQTKKCRLRPNKNELADDPQFDIDAELEKIKESKRLFTKKEGTVVNITVNGTWNGDAVEGNKYVNIGFTDEEKLKLKNCVEDNNISKDELEAIVSVLEEINKSQNDLLTEYAYMASETRNGERDGFFKKLQEKITLTNGVTTLARTIGEVATQHPEAIQGIVGFLGSL